MHYTNHTKGPWKLGQRVDYGEENEYFMEILGPNDEVIAKVYVPDSNWVVPVNYGIVRAAPELLDSLKHIARASLSNDFAKYYAKQAISKVEGG